MESAIFTTLSIIVYNFTVLYAICSWRLWGSFGFFPAAGRFSDDLHPLNRCSRPSPSLRRLSRTLFGARNTVHEAAGRASGLIWYWGVFHTPSDILWCSSICRRTEPCKNTVLSSLVCSTHLASPTCDKDCELGSSLEPWMPWSPLLSFPGSLSLAVKELNFH